MQLVKVTTVLYFFVGVDMDAGTGSRSHQLFDFLSLLPLQPDNTTVSTVSAFSSVRMP